MRGRKPIPQEVLNLRGTDRKDRQRPSSTLGAPIAPQDIRKCQVAGLNTVSARARRIYWTLIKQFAGERLLEMDFLGQVLMYATYMDEWIACTEDIEEKGYVCTGVTKTGAIMKYHNPSVKMRDNATEKLLKIGSNFGLSPVDRQRLKAQVEDPKAKGIKAIFAAIVADEGEETPDEQ